MSATGSAFAAQKWADSKGRFKFRRLRPGTYSLSALIPGHGEILQTVEITRSFSDAKGRVEKKFRFDEETLRARARSVPQGLISLRELSIPSNALREYERAEKRLERHDVERAIQHLEKAVALAPQFVEALNRLGTIYFQRKEFSKAESYFREALHQEPEAYAPLVNLGGALLAQKRSQEALEINLHAQNARPRDPLANAQLGLSYFLLGDYEQAVAYLQVTKEIDPAHFSQPQISLAEIHLRRSEDAAAVRELQDFLKYHPDSPEAEGVRATIRKIQQSRSPSPE